MITTMSVEITTGRFYHHSVMTSLSADFIPHFCHTPINGRVKCSPRREGETASSLREQMSMLGQKGLETSGCGGNSINLGVCSSQRLRHHRKEQGSNRQASEGMKIR